MLLVLAVLSFIPGLGVLFGSAAVTWGLLSTRPRARLAVGIAAAGVLLQFVVFVAFLVSSSRNRPLLDQALGEVTRQDLLKLVRALESYHQRESFYPASLPALQSRHLFARPVNIFDQSAGLSLRFRPFQYRLAEDGSGYDLFAVGPDGEPHTADDIRPALPDSLRRHSGYRPKE
jgi:hypothetical protein